jgi:hypothetical protein
LKGLAGGALASVSSFAGLFHNPVFAAETKKAQKHCILLWLCGAPSQFETWDPKPGRPGAGHSEHPDAAPGNSFFVADAEVRGHRRQAEHRAQHEDGAVGALPGHHAAAAREPERAGFTRPTLGCALSQAMGQLDSPIPNFILLDPIPGGNEFESFKAGNWAGWLGAEHAPVRLGGDYTQLINAAAASIPQQDREARETLRKFLTAKYERDRKSGVARSQNAAFERMKGMTASADLLM